MPVDGVDHFRLDVLMIICQQALRNLTPLITTYILKYSSVHAEAEIQEGYFWRCIRRVGLNE